MEADCGAIGISPAKGLFDPPDPIPMAGTVRFG